MRKGKLKTDVWGHAMSNYEREWGMAVDDSIWQIGKEGDVCWVTCDDAGLRYCLVAKNPSPSQVIDDGFFIPADFDLVELEEL